MRDLILLLLVAGLLPIALLRPFFGLLLYAWLSFMRPQDMAWDLSQQLPLSQLAAIAMLLGLVLAMRRERMVAVRPQTVLLFLLVLWIALSTATAILPELSMEIFGHYWKAVAVALVTTGLVQTRARLRLLWAVVAASIGLLGVKFAVFGLLRGGTRFNAGPGGMLTDNNSFAVALCMVVPMLVALASTERDRRARAAALVMAGLCVITVLFTFSRGGLITLGVTGLLLVARSRQRWLAAAVLVVAVGGFALASSDRVRDTYVERAASIADYEVDPSALSRLESWETCWRVFLDYPVLGVGPNNLQSVYWRYSPVGDVFHVAHNAWLQVLSESGLPGLLLFVGLQAVCLWRLERLRRARGDWPGVYASMLQIALVAYAVGSMFLNLAYLELLYQLCGLAVSLELAAGWSGSAATVEASDEDGWWQAPAAEVA